MLLRHNKLTELFYVCDRTVRFSTCCWTNCFALPNMTFHYSCDARWLSKKPLSRGWLHLFAVAVVFYCKYFSIVRVTQVRLLYFLWKDIPRVATEIYILCVVFWRKVSQFWVTSRNKYLINPLVRKGKKFYTTNHASCLTSFCSLMGLE